MNFIMGQLIIGLEEFMMGSIMRITYVLSLIVKKLLIYSVNKLYELFTKKDLREPRSNSNLLGSYNYYKSPIRNSTPFMRDYTNREKTDLRRHSVDLVDKLTKSQHSKPLPQTPIKIVNQNVNYEQINSTKSSNLYNKYWNQNGSRSMSKINNDSKFHEKPNGESSFQSRPFTQRGRGRWRKNATSHNRVQDMTPDNLYNGIATSRYGHEITTANNGRTSSPRSSQYTLNYTEFGNYGRGMKVKTLSSRGIHDYPKINTTETKDKYLYQQVVDQADDSSDTPIKLTIIKTQDKPPKTQSARYERGSENRAKKSKSILKTSKMVTREFAENSTVELETNTSIQETLSNSDNNITSNNIPEQNLLGIDSNIEPPSSSTWICTFCTLKNDLSYSICQLCAKSNPEKFESANLVISRCSDLITIALPRNELSTQQIQTNTVNANNTLGFHRISSVMNTESPIIMNVNDVPIIPRGREHQQDIVGEQATLTSSTGSDVIAAFSAPALADASLSTWQCSFCTFENQSSAKICEVCSKTDPRKLKREVRSLLSSEQVDNIDDRDDDDGNNHSEPIIRHLGIRSRQRLLEIFQ